MVTLDRAASRHMLKVLRLRPPAELCLFNGTGYDFKARLLNDGNCAQVSIESQQACTTESPLRINLLQCVSRGDRMDFAVQKSVELGVAAIHPVWSEHSPARMDDRRTENKLRHWQQIAISACEQSGRSTVPVVHSPVEVFDCVQDLSADISLMPHPGASERLAGLPVAQAGTVNLIIGPEGGFSSEEIDRALSADIHCVRLGPRVLRTETAAIAALTLLQEKAGDLR